MKQPFLILVLVSHFLPTVPSPTTSDIPDLACWVCNSNTNPKCNEENFSKEESPNITKTACSKIQKASNSRDRAITCFKSVFKAGKGAEPIVSRTCAFLGNPNFANIHDPICHFDNNQITGYTTVNCFCRGNYCNHSTTTNLLNALLIIPFVQLVGPILNYLNSINSYK